MNQEEQQDKISCERFIQLSQEEQNQLIYKHRVSLAERKEERYDVYLWQLWSFTLK